MQQSYNAKKTFSIVQGDHSPKLQMLKNFCNTLTFSCTFPTFQFNVS